MSKRKQSALARTLADAVSSLETELTALMRDVIGTPSPPGHEKDVSVLLAQWLEEHGIAARVQEIEETRANVVGTVPGGGSGPSLTFNAHMDTSFAGNDSDLPILGERSNITPAHLTIGEDSFSGLGVHNDKGPFVAACIAALAIKKAGLTLSGDLLLAGVAGEIGTGEVGAHTGPATRGKGLGTYHLLHKGAWTDYALVCESSNWSIVWALPGAAYYQVVTRGEPIYAPLSVRDENEPAGSKNAIVKAAHLVLALEEWAVAYEAENELQTPCGTMKPRVTIGAIEGGRPSKPNYRPGVASVFVDVRVPPNRTPLDVKRELERAVADTGLAVEVNMYLARRGYVGQGIEPLRDAIAQAHEHVFSAAPEPPGPSNLSQWNDANIYWEVGIPAVKYGLPRAPTALYPERVRVDDIRRASQVYALTAANLCGIAKGP